MPLGRNRSTPKRQRETGDHRNEEDEAYRRRGRRPRLDDGFELKNEPLAQVFQQEQRQHEGNQGAKSNQDQHPEQREDDVRTPRSEKRETTAPAASGENVSRGIPSADRATV